MTTETAKKNPTYLVKYLSDGEGKSYPVKIGASFPTEKGNEKLVFEVTPTELFMGKGFLILTPFKEKGNDE